MEKNWMAFLQQETQLSEVIETNRLTGQFGLVLSEQDAKLILEERKNTPLLTRWRAGTMNCIWKLYGNFARGKCGWIIRWKN